ncbi:ATP-binding cassette domain-containing protein [Candidatus Sumerlaeota bacterium]|nr:ATP-binding cassette domain-containing protein [Candidatus Sumerlaeota bacterium]
MEFVVRDMHKSFNGNHVLRGLSLDIAEGKITVVLGGSGCGKTVLLKHLMGILKPDSGSVQIDGKDITHYSERELLPIRIRIGLIFQGGALLNSLSVFENCALGLREHRLEPEKEIRRIVKEKLEILGLGDRLNERPANLSGGMRKRVAIARALTMNPEAILWDEPTTGIDPPRASRIDNMIREMSDRIGVTTVVVTHDLISAFNLADMVYFIHEGRIVESGPPDEFRRSTNEHVREFLRRRYDVGDER